MQRSLEELSRGKNVQCNLRLQRVRPIELALFPQTLPESHFQPAAGHRLAKIEDVALDREAVPVECWAHSDVGNGAIGRFADHALRRINSLCRQEFLLGREIQRREYNFRSAPRARL